jgi:hypothetical protein
LLLDFNPTDGTRWERVLVIVAKPDRAGELGVGNAHRVMVIPVKANLEWGIVAAEAAVVVDNLFADADVEH